MSGAVAETVAGETVERKLDPEALAIRARPIRAIRFKRGLIVGLAGAAVIVLAVIAWFALKPHVFRVVAQPEAVAEPEARPDPLSRPPPDRERLLPVEGLPPRRHPL